jgi:hypothetical protein
VVYRFENLHFCRYANLELILCVCICAIFRMAVVIYSDFYSCVHNIRSRFIFGILATAWVFLYIL